MKQLNLEEFESTIQGKVAVQFSAGWCGPCKVLTKTIQANESDLQVDFYKVDIDANQSIASKYGIRSVPTLILFESGAEVKRVIGNKTLQQLKEFAGS